MDLKLALRFIFGCRQHLATLVRAGLIACVPIIGQLVLHAYALRVIRAAAFDDDSPISDFRLDVHTLIIGFKCQLFIIGATLAAGLLTLPLWTLDHRSADTSSTDPTTATTALIGAFQSPTSLLTTAIVSIISALCLARFATTGSALSALDLPCTWAHLRAQPALWLGTAIVGFVIAEAPVSLALVLPFSVENQVPALLVATALFWPLALMFQAHLIGQAYYWSDQTITRRRPLIVRVRW